MLLLEVVVVLGLEALFCSGVGWLVALCLRALFGHAYPWWPIAILIWLVGVCIVLMRKDDSL